MFRSKKHEVNMVALNRDDDKQIAKKDGIFTLVHGHRSICWSPLLGEIVLKKSLHIFACLKMPHSFIKTLT